MLERKSRKMFGWKVVGWRSRSGGREALATSLVSVRKETHRDRETFSTCGVEPVQPATTRQSRDGIAVLGEFPR
jgi:hypothetical protein